MTVAYAEEPMMPHQPQKITTVQSPQQTQHSDSDGSADEQVNGVTGCCEKIPDNCADCKSEANEPETFESEEEKMHVTNVELLSETDDAKRVLKNACDFEVREKILVNRCDETDDVKIERGDENGLASTEREEKLVENAVEIAEDATNVTCVKSRNAEETEISKCVFDRNENLREGLESVESKIIVVCEPYMVRDTERNALQCNSVEDEYDPEDELNFHEAVRAGDAKSVEKIIARRKTLNLDEPDWNVSGDPPLLVAATNHCLPVLRVLLDNGCDPAVRSPRGETALHRAILNGGAGNVLKFVGELLAYGCPAAVKEAGGGLTALHVLTRQLAHAQGSKSLHHDFEAALKTLELLANAGPVNAKDHQGRSALHILATSTVFDNTHRTEIESLIKILLDAGADPSLKNDRGETPLHESLECGALNTAILLTSHTPVGITSRYGETPLHIASRKNYAEMVKLLLEHGEDPSVQDAGGNTPLHLASARGFHQTVSLLVTSPLAQLEKTNSDGLTALQVAAESGFVNAVRLLLKAGADPSQTVPYCSTTLHRHPDISVLIDHELTRRRQLAA